MCSLLNFTYQVQKLLSYPLYAHIFERDITAVALGTSSSKKARGDGLPVYREDFFKFVEKRGYVIYARGTDYARGEKSLHPLDRQDMDTAYLHELVRKFDHLDENSNGKLDAYIGTKFRGLRLMNNAGDVRQVMRLKFIMLFGM